MVESGTILIGVIVPLIIGPISVFLKSLWDRYNNSIEIRKTNNYEMKKKELSEKINIFYWPVYLRLKTLDRLNYSVKYRENNMNEYQLELNKVSDLTLSDSSDGGNNNKMRRRRKRNKICSILECQNINYKPDVSDKCYKCRSETVLNSEIMVDSDNIESNIKDSYEWDNYDTKPIRMVSIKEIEVSNDSEEEDEKLLVSVDRTFIINLDKKILDICMEIKELIEKNISIIQPSKILINEIVRFTRYAEMLYIVYESKRIQPRNVKYDILNMGVVNNTEKFQEIIKSNLDFYMTEQAQLIHDYNSVDTKCC